MAQARNSLYVQWLFSQGPSDGGEAQERTKRRGAKAVPGVLLKQTTGTREEKGAAWCRQLWTSKLARTE